MGRPAAPDLETVGRLSTALEAVPRDGRFRAWKVAALTMGLDSIDLAQSADGNEVGGLVDRLTTTTSCL